MDEIVIRTAGLRDLDVLLKFEKAMIEAERPFDSTIRSGSDIRYYDLDGLIASEDTEIVVAEIGDTIIGSGYARIEASKAYLEHRQHAYLGFMYVVPEHRGKGVNGKILNVLESWAASRNITELRLEVYFENAAAIRAYEKSSYKSLVVEMRKGLSRT